MNDPVEVGGHMREMDAKHFVNDRSINTRMRLFISSQQEVGRYLYSREEILPGTPKHKCTHTFP